MPYVPSKKTDGNSTDREQLNVAVEALAKLIASKVKNNLSLIDEYKIAFTNVAMYLAALLERDVNMSWGVAVGSVREDQQLAKAIFDIGQSYGYEGAYLGELNYSITRLIQRVPQIKVEQGDWAQEIRYWLYAATVEALISTAYQTHTIGIGVGGVFEDVKDEYKRRVNTAYEAEQILKSGDCYDTPYYTRLVRVVNEDGQLVGHQEIMLKRSDATLSVDMLDGEIVLKQR